MASWRDESSPANAADDRDNLGRPIDVIRDQAEVLSEQPSAPTTMRDEPAPRSWRTDSSPLEQEVKPKTNSWRDNSSQVTYEDIMPSLTDGAALSASLPPETGKTGIDYSFLTELGEGELTKKRAMEDPRITDAMKAGLDFRFGNRGIVANLGTALAGGATGSFTEDMSNEDVFEMWENWQRSFAGGQTTTTVNEVAFMSTLDEADKANLGGQYSMFLKKPEIYSSSVGWGEKLDGVRDYAVAGVWDPLTLASLGLGKVLGIGTSKAAALSVRGVAMAAFRASLKKGATREAAVQASLVASKRELVKVGVISPAKSYGLDVVSNIVSDVAQQNVYIDGGAQEEFHLSQTVMAGFGTMLLPMIVGGSKGFSKWASSDDAPAIFKSAVDIAEEFKGLSKADVLAAQRARINMPQVDDDMAKLLQNFGDHADDYSKWSVAKGEAKDAIGSTLTTTDNERLFMRSFLYGNPSEKNGAKGFVNTMTDAGLIFVERGDTNITNFIGDAINFLPENSTVVADFIKTFQRKFGSISSEIDAMTTPKELSAFWKTRQSEGANRLWDSRHGADMLKTALKDDPTNSALAAALKREMDPKTKKAREVGKYGLSLYKSALTSTWSTAMLNVQGWGATQAAGMMSDFVQGSIELMTAPAIRLLKGDDAYRAAVRAGKGSISGALRRGVNFLAPGDNIDKALNYMEYRPNIHKELSRDLGGDSGAAAGTDTLVRMGLDPKDPFNIKLEKGREFLQVVSGQKLQDETTKMLSWMSNVDLMIRREYGVNYNQFMTDPKLGWLEMNTARYRGVVEANALDRTKREVYSQDYTTKKGSSLALSAARYMEDISANPVGGYLIPFGKFFNNSMAMMGDYSMLNATRVLGGRVLLGKSKSSLASEDLPQLFAKGVVGLTAAYLMSEKKMSNLDEGLSWNATREDDGSLTDETFKFPESMLHLAGQVVAHYRRDGEVPPELAAQAVDFTVGQTFRGASDAVQTVGNFSRALAEGQFSAAEKQAVDIALGSMARIISGVTRPMDMLNQPIKIATGDWSEADKNTSGDDWTEKTLTKKGTRYFDEFFEMFGLGSEESPRVAKPTASYQQGPDASRITGTRSLAGNTLPDQIMNSVGIPTWQAFRWGNDPELKNYMNSIVAPLFEAQAKLLLTNHPDFFKMPLENRQVLVKEVIKKAKEQAQATMEARGGDFSYRDRLAKVNKRHLEKVMTAYELKGSPLDLLKTGDGGLIQLETILSIAEDYEEMGMIKYF
jgi:hypothetical protein